MQQIPASNAYRNCFVPNYPDWVFVSADYSSQELCFIAEKSKDPVWIAALDAGHDLHSICADLVFKDKWKQAAETDCVYMTDKEKCECPGHKKLRTFVKAINFGLAYGMSEFKLSDTMDSTVEEAKALIEEYFKTFPKISGLLNFLGKFGLEHGYIQTFAPYYRRRYFTNYDPENPDFKVKGQIERASKNTPKIEWVV